MSTKKLALILSILLNIIGFGLTGRYYAKLQSAERKIDDQNGEIAKRRMFTSSLEAHVRNGELPVVDRTEGTLHFTGWMDGRRTTTIFAPGEQTVRTDAN